MGRNFPKRSNYNRVHPLNYQRPVVRPAPQVQAQIYIDANGYFIFVQIGGVLYRNYLNLGPGNSSNTANPVQESKNPPKMNPHEVLGVPVSATMVEITKAFRRKAKENHPDTVAQKTPESLALADQKMKEINEAYKLLKSSNTSTQPNQGKK